MKKRAIFILFYIMFQLLFLLPVLYIILISFNKSISPDLDLSVLKDINFTFEKYYMIFSDQVYIRSYIFTFIISVVIASFNTIFSIMTGYVLCDRGNLLSFKIAPYIIFIYILVMMMPFQVTLLPNYILIKLLGMYDTVWALILPGVFNPFGTFFIIQMLKTVDDSIITATRLETNSNPRILLYVVAPQIKSGITALFVIIFAESWNMVEQVMILTKSDNYRTLGTLLNNFFAYNNSAVYAGGVIYMLPVIILYLVFRKSIRNSFSLLKF